jgi:hypothetical protein
MARKAGDRVLHPRLGSGTVLEVDENKLTIQFDAGNTSRIVDSFVTRWGDMTISLSGLRQFPLAAQRGAGK